MIVWWIVEGLIGAGGYFLAMDSQARGIWVGEVIGLGLFFVAGVMFIITSLAVSYKFSTELIRDELSQNYGLVDAVKQVKYLFERVGGKIGTISRGTDPVEILKARLARGEITPDEFEQILRKLYGSREK